MSAKGHIKGPAYERKVCQRLSLWASCQRRDDLFWRTATSGGRATFRARTRPGQPIVTQVGDVCSLHAEGSALTKLFVIECKRWGFRKMELDRLASGRTSRFFVFWKKLYEEAAAANRQPLLVFHENNADELMATTRRGASYLEDGALEGPLEPVVTYPRVGILVYPLRDLFTEVNYQAMREAMARRGKLRR